MLGDRTVITVLPSQTFAAAAPPPGQTVVRAEPDLQS